MTYPSPTATNEALTKLDPVYEATGNTAPLPEPDGEYLVQIQQNINGQCHRWHRVMHWDHHYGWNCDDGSKFVTLAVSQVPIRWMRISDMDRGWIRQRLAKNQGQQPTPGQIYQHHKHDPANGEWHEYEVVCVVEAGTLENLDHLYVQTPWVKFQHTETGEIHGLYCQGKNGDVLAQPPLGKRHVAYKSTKNHLDTAWLRPLDMFMDGRFNLAQA